MTKILLIPILILFYLPALSQDCSVLLEGIDEEYKGDCKRGRAHGTGVAKGSLGKYEGDFKKGYPDGVGKLDYADGSYYSGDWSRGFWEGRGVYHYSNDSIVDGFWKDNRYMGEFENPYEIISKRGTSRVSFIKMNDSQNKVQIMFMRGGTQNTSQIENYYLTNSSGIQVNSSNYIGFDAVEFPMQGTVNFRAQNELSTSTSQELINFKINEKGAWLIKINY
ncbi:hypothetical protein [Fulvivirga lutimaris]|uniref:hypothetical protein n=1 Tax=Fulvivirga lutimaris TaxID=1819566 RepID=UPI0012BC8E4C|nr:hypothetical protein [Fulvivirga lutimaris]MTI38001.1 hypothetical protein [Fulvivirga lutimaris]